MSEPSSRERFPSSDERLVEAAAEFLTISAKDWETDEEFCRIALRQSQIEAMMNATQARSLSGLRAKARVLKEMLAPSPDGEMTDAGECENRVAWSLATDIERACEEEASSSDKST